VIESIKKHYETTWGKPATVRTWMSGPVHELPKGFFVAEVAPLADERAWIYATCGMSLLDDADPLELHLLAPFQDNSHVELLTFICHYHVTGCRLGLGHTVNFGRPWLPGSTCSFGLISLPYLYGPRLEKCTVSGRTVNCYWLIPITQQERDFKKQEGPEALEIRFEEAVVNYLDPERECVV
jgi:hypothetical protein